MKFFTTILVLCALFRTIRTLPHTTTRAVSATSKAGLAWGGGQADVTQFTTTGKVSWYYTWSAEPAGFSDSSIEFVPQLWGAQQGDDFASTINQTISSQHVTAVLGMNEPQEVGQSNLTPEQGVQIWMEYLQPLKAQGVLLGSPAPSSAPSSMTWLQSFFQICNGSCTVDFIALHYYDVNATNFQEYMTLFYQTFNKPIWVTEWACQNFNNGPQCTADEISSFLGQTQGWMDETDWMQRYAWFGAMENLGGVNPDDALMSSSGTITSLGKQYIGSSSGADPVSVSSASQLEVAPWMLLTLLFLVYPLC